MRTTLCFAVCVLVTRVQSQGWGYQPPTPPPSSQPGWGRDPWIPEPATPDWSKNPQDASANPPPAWAPPDINVVPHGTGDMWHPEVATPFPPLTPNSDKEPTEFPGDIISNRQVVLERGRSPYVLREDLIVDKTGELIVEPGVEVRFAPMTGITVRGILTARGTPEERILLTGLQRPSFGEQPLEVPPLRLVDGPSIVVGRLQMFHKGQWRSVCTNTRNWTRIDMEIACRQLGFHGGAWWNWLDREPGEKPRLLWEEPRCRGAETDLKQCDWNSRQLGSGVCDYHPDLGIQCLPNHVSSPNVVHHWRGVRFEGASFERTLTQENTLYVRKSLSELANVEIRYAGVGRDYNASSAIHVEGVPPRMIAVAVTYSAYNALNITTPTAPLVMKNCTIRNNRGYGVYVNSSTGLAHIENSLIMQNGGDGVRYVHHDQLENTRFDRSEVFDFCTFPTTASQTFPITITVEQGEYTPTEKDCSKYFFTRPGHVLTLHFLRVMTDRNESATIEVFDGTAANDELLATIVIRNGTKPQSITTTRHNVFVRFRAQARTQIIGFMKLTSGYRKSYDLNITGSTIADNNGRGIAVENLRSQLHIHQTSVSNNNHVAGVHVLGGAADVNITDSRIAFNIGDGVNISYVGGSRNISYSWLSSNKGNGLSVWLNDSKYAEHVAFNQETIIAYTEVYKNLDTGLLIGNFCGPAIVNVTGNWFNNSLNTGLEVISCWRQNTSALTKLQIGHNVFVQNKKLGVKLKPVLNMEGKIEHNQFSEHLYGGLLIRNPRIEGEEHQELMPVKLTVQHNDFSHNRGVFAVSIGLSQYAERRTQYLLFTRNFVRYNRIREPFDSGGEALRLVPRSRVAAPLVISSSNLDVYRNILENHESQYEIGSQLEDQSEVINCTFNWLGYSLEEKIFSRLFHRKDRYNLAKIEYLPYLLHSSNPGATIISANPTFVPHFHKLGTNAVGGEVDGLENLRAGEYIVERDINVRPGGRLTLQPGVTLRFPPSVGMMVAGKLEARGKGPNDIRLTLREDRIEISENDTDTGLLIPEESKVPVRLLGGRSYREGRLQVRIDGIWGTVCNYGWTRLDAALVCHQLGLVLNPDDWFLERSEIPQAGTAENILLSNVRCDADDIDITQCRSEKPDEFEFSCNHDNDVGLRCYETSWAGMRLGVVAERADLQFITVEKAGLLDYTTNTFKPALQVDFAKHALENVRIVDNMQDGLGVIYSDLYSSGGVNTVRNCEFSNNRGSGVSLKQLGLKIHGSTIENNWQAGVRHNPALSALQQRELAGWFKPPVDLATQYAPYIPLFVPHTYPSIELDDWSTRILITQRVTGDPINKTFFVKCKPGFVIGIQLLNPIHNRSTEEIIVRDAHSVSGKLLAAAWDVRLHQTIFPAASSSYGAIIEYSSGADALGGCVIVLSSVQVSLPDPRLRLVRGPVPTLTVTNSRIRNNRRGIWASYYNRYLTEHGDHFLRKANESIQIIGCDLSHNKEEAVHVHSPFWDIHRSNLSEIKITINNSLITDNGRGIYQFSRDMRSSNNLFHWILFDNSIERNHGGGFDVALPYVWDYNENYTHTLYLSNNTWRDNKNFAFVVDGHFAAMNLTRNLYDSNHCKTGLISIQGMEKRLNIYRNRIERNTGTFMVEFRADSQSEIMGNVDAVFFENEVRYNIDSAQVQRGYYQVYRSPSCVVGFHGIQKVRVRRNLLSNNDLDYSLVAGVRTAQLASAIDVSENWWGTSDPQVIREKIFDFDDWNNHAQAIFRPYLVEDNFDASLSVSFEQPTVFDTNRLGGRLKDSVTLFYRPEPYLVYSDITILPEAALTINPGVVMEFAPNVGILVLGRLHAQGRRGLEIIMRPMSVRSRGPSGVPVADIPGNHLRRKRRVDYPNPSQGGRFSDSIRLCTGRNCTQQTHEGFLEYYNRTTLQWVPLCDDRFTERNAQVVCRELGYDSLNVFVYHGERVEFHTNSLTRIWSWPEPLQCKGDEAKLEDCAIRLNGQLYGHRHRCEWNSPFVFIHCGKRNLFGNMDYWGGVRFANAEFEQNFYEHRIHDVVTHQTIRRSESMLEFVNIVGAGILHNEKSPAIQAVVRAPVVMSVNISLCASHGINLITPADTVRLLFNRIEDTLGVGVNAISLTGEGRESESSFNPLRELNLPYHVFSMIDICDPTKVITIEERVLIYFKYDNHAVNCVKIFNSVYHVKPFGFRLLQFNLFNTSAHPGRPDSITLYDGDIYNVSASVLANIEVGGGMERKLYRTRGPKLSVKLFANGGSNVHGFIAEIVTLPISAIGFNRDVQHNISFSIMNRNQRGAVSYASAGEVNPTVTLEWNQIRDNGEKLYGNFTSAEAAVMMDVQNTQMIFFRNNLVERNTGGLWIRSDSGGSATALKGWIHNNLFSDNAHRPALSVEGRQSSPYQEVTIYRNYFTRNYAPYHNVIILKQVVSNFTYNYLHRNWGGHILEVSGFEKVRLPIYQTTSHNGFYFNYAVDRESRGTIVAGTAGQHYVDNVLFDPDNDYEIVTVNRSRAGIDSSLDVWKTPIDAKHNWWGYNETLAVLGRIKDRTDEADLLEVDFRPFHMNNRTVLSGKCPPGWTLVGDTCYIYIGAPMTFYEARNFCRSDNASMPYVMSNYLALYHFLKLQQQDFRLYHHVWVQNIDRINQCTAFAYQSVEVDHCERLNPFICEMDPIVHVDPLSWRDDVVTLAVLGTVGAAIILVALAGGFWFSKSRRRQEERFQRRNSIRQSLHSVRSLGSVHGAPFAEIGYRRKEPFTTGAHHSQRSSPTLTKGSDYKKMNGSLDSMDKSQFNSSVEDNQSYDIYETHNSQSAAMAMDARGGFSYTGPSSGFSGRKFPSAGEALNPAFDLSFRNEGFRDNSTFASRDNSVWQSTVGSEVGGEDHSPSEGGDYLTNASTLPLNRSFATANSSVGADAHVSPEYGSETTFRPTDTPDPYYDHRERLREVSESYFDPKGSPKPYFSSKATPEPYYQPSSAASEPMYNMQERPKSSHMLLDANIDNSANTNGLPTPPHPPSRSKSEALLETNFDVYVPPTTKSSNGNGITPASRSKSQPLETAM